MARRWDKRQVSREALESLVFRLAEASVLVIFGNEKPNTSVLFSLFFPRPDGTVIQKSAVSNGTTCITFNNKFWNVNLVTRKESTP